MIKVYYLCSLFFVFLISCNSYKEIKTEKQNISLNLNQKILFFNVENLFDTINTPLKRDGEFTPNGSKLWDTKKYYQKINDISKTILGVSEGELPSLIGLAEVESDLVLKDLCNHSPLEKFSYQFIHKESNDRRGIDVALLYLPEKILIIDTSFINVDLGDGKFTRDILYAKIKFLKNNLVLNVFVNHWPSRYGGQNQSEYKRISAAKVLKKHTDSLFNLNEDVLLMGDFNDYPYNSSLKDILLAKSFRDSSKLVNLMYDVNESEGSYFYGGYWGALDQFIVSNSLLTNLKFDIDSISFFKKSWNLQNKKPYRTYSGSFYKGGISDHLPIVLYYNLF